VPGLGKSTLAIATSASITRGTLDGDLFGEPRNVLYASGEDNLATTVVPRLIAAEADLTRVQFLAIEDDGGEDLLNLPGDVERIAAEIAKYRPALVVVDPFVAFLAGEIDTHRDSSVRRALAPIARLAEEYEVAFEAIVHLNKKQETDILRRVSGSGGFAAAARSVLAFGSDPNDPDTRVLVHAKCNVAREAPSLAYRIETAFVDGDNGAQIETSVAVEAGESSVTKHDLLDSATPDERAECIDCADVIAAELADGPRRSADMLALLDAQGYGNSAIRAAKKKLRVRSTKEGFGETGVWIWRLPVTGAAKGLESENHPLSPLSPVSRTKGFKASKETASSTPVAADPLSNLTADERQTLEAFEQVFDGSREPTQDE
jgi:hypothetical protein